MLQVSSIDASWLNTHILWLPCTMNQCTCPVQVQRSVVQKINANITVCLMWWRLAAYSGCWLRHHGHVISSDYDELLRIPDHPITAEPYGTDLVTHVHSKALICAKHQCKHSGHVSSAVITQSMIQIPAHQPILHLTRGPSAYTSNLLVCVFSAYLTSDSSWVLCLCTSELLSELSMELLSELSMSAQLQPVRVVATHQLSLTCWDSPNAVIPLQHDPTRSCNDKDLDLGQEATLYYLVAGKDGKDHQQ